MRLFKDAIKWAYHTGSGQLGQIHIVNGRAILPKDSIDEEIMEVPDEWILQVKSGAHRLALTPKEKQWAYLYLSREGFENTYPLYKDEIRTGVDMKSHLESLWNNVEKGTEKYKERRKKKLEKELRELGDG